jgi:excisionase family DNA binding protein
MKMKTKTRVQDEMLHDIGIPNQAVFTLKEVAKIFKVHVRTVERWIEGQRLAAIVLPGGKSLRVTYQEIVRVFSQTTT